MNMVFVEGIVELVKREPNRTRIRVREFLYKKRDGTDETILYEVSKFGSANVEIGDKIVCRCKLKSWEKNGFVNMSLDCDAIFYDVENVAVEKQIGYGESEHKPIAKLNAQSNTKSNSNVSDEDIPF